MTPWDGSIAEPKHRWLWGRPQNYQDHGRIDVLINNAGYGQYAAAIGQGLKAARPLQKLPPLSKTG
jgi:hypothetical protein